jgi:hypothetical protein
VEVRSRMTMKTEEWRWKAVGGKKGEAKVRREGNEG